MIFLRMAGIMDVLELLSTEFVINLLVSIECRNIEKCNTSFYPIMKYITL